MLVARIAVQYVSDMYQSTREVRYGLMYAIGMRCAVRGMCTYLVQYGAWYSWVTCACSWCVLLRILMCNGVWHFATSGTYVHTGTRCGYVCMFTYMYVRSVPTGTISTVCQVRMQAQIYCTVLHIHVDTRESTGTYFWPLLYMKTYHMLFDLPGQYSC